MEERQGKYIFLQGKRKQMGFTCIVNSRTLSFLSLAALCTPTALPNPIRAAAWCYPLEGSPVIRSGTCPEHFRSVISYLQYNRHFLVKDKLSCF